jgi:hypothetical protein
MADISRQEAVQYLLGESTETEREALEQRCLKDETVAEEIEAFENELVDDYVAGRLAAADQGRFERSYLAAPGRAEKVAFARALRARIGLEQGTPVPLPRLLNLAAAALLGIAGAYFAYRFNQARHELSRLGDEQASLERRERDLSGQLLEARAERDRLEKELESARKAAESSVSGTAAVQPDSVSTVTFTLAGSLARDSGGPKVLEIRSGTKEIRLSMPLPAEPYASYSAEIRTPEGKEIWKAGGLAARRAGSTISLAISVRAAVLAQGDYIVSVQGLAAGGALESVADFAFRVRFR